MTDDHIELRLHSMEATIATLAARQLTLAAQNAHLKTVLGQVGRALAALAAEEDC